MFRLLCFVLRADCPAGLGCGRRHPRETGQPQGVPTAAVPPLGGHRTRGQRQHQHQRQRHCASASTSTNATAHERLHELVPASFAAEPARQRASVPGSRGRPHPPRPATAPRSLRRVCAQRAAPHIKTYVRYAAGGTVSASTSASASATTSTSTTADGRGLERGGSDGVGSSACVDWCVVGSHNLSKAAWCATHAQH